MKPPKTIAFSNRRYLDAVADHVVIFDGATGTELAKFALTSADFGGAQTHGLWEMLLFQRPDLVTQVHTRYLNAGAEAIKTNSFRANPINLAELGLADRVHEIGQTAAQLAHQAAAHARAATGIPRFVAGSMGPSGKLPSLDDPELSDISFAELVTAYADYARGLITGGVDLLLLETHQDLLEIKAAIHGIWRVFEELSVRIPIQAQVTLEASSHMLSGPDVEAALVTLAALPVDVIGLNCSTGPDEMRESVRRLLALSQHPISIMPNAGMPENVNGQAHYRMLPAPFAATMSEFVDWGVRIIGGCCGTGPEHIVALQSVSASQRLSVSASQCLSVSVPQRSSGAAASAPLPSPLPFLASNIQATALHQEPRPLLVGERINTQGSRKARRLVLKRRFDALVALAESQVANGAHVLDVCVALTERGDEAETMAHITKLLALSTPAPLMFDTTDLNVMHAALLTYPGRAIINSVNLEAGEDPARAVMTLAHDFGATLVALTIDETGMAKDVAHKLAVAQRLYHLAVDEVGLPPHALIFDLLTFTLATGEADIAGSAIATLDALRDIKVALPGVLTNLGISNVSFGLTPPARRVLNSVFLYHAVQAGLDMAIVNPAQITPYAEIPTAARELADNLIFNRHPEALTDFITHFADVKITPETTTPVADLPLTEQLYNAILYRRRAGVEALVEACLEQHTPVDVLNTMLFPAMQDVGDRFGKGELILPFVLKSAEVMKAAVAQLEPHFDRADSVSKGTLVLATVFGDVHDIGKNLVKIILENNGYTVHDLGKQVPVATIIDKAIAVHADAIGLSALLVATSQQMQRCVAELHRRGLRIPVLVGGAAINERFAQRIALLENGGLYMGGVYHCQDAFEALQVLEHVIMHRPDGEEGQRAEGRGENDVIQMISGCVTCGGGCGTISSSTVCQATDIPAPPFWGTRHISNIAWADLEPHLDRKSLFRVGWGARGATGEKWASLEAEFNTRLSKMWLAAGQYLAPQAIYGYFPAQSQGNSLLIYDPSTPSTRREIARFDFPRQSKNARLCLADYFSPVSGGILDVVALQVVTVGPGATARFGVLDAAGAYSEAYFVHGLAAHTAEAIAAWLHQRIRDELGLLTKRGKRYSWGYPACPDVGAHHTVFQLLPAAAQLDITLSSAGQLIPEHSTTALIVHHPQAKYFKV